MKNTWAVMCGAIREELEVRLTIDKLLEMRESEKIVGIILSTWIGEFDRFPELKRELEENHVEIIEQSPLEKRVDLNRSNSINFMRQALQFQAALDHLPEDCFVLKVRTDRALNHIKKFESYLSEEPVFIGPHFFNGAGKKEMPTIFKYKIAVIGAKVHRIFNFSDFVFWGYAEDVRKLLNFDIAELSVNRDLVANTQWYIYPFFQNFPIIRDYFRLMNFRPLIMGMKNYFEGKEVNDYFPKFFYRVYASYLLVLSHYFDLVDVAYQTYDDSYHFRDLFLDKKQSGIVHTQLGSVLMTNQVVNGFLDAEKCKGIESDKFFHKYLWSEELFSPVSNEEYEELKAFAKNKGWNLAPNWLRERNWRKKILQQKNTYQKNMLNYHFEGLNDNENSELIEQLKSKERVDVFLYNYWLNHPKLGCSSAEQMVLPFARTQNQNAVLILSRMLRLGMITDEKTQESVHHLIQVMFDVQCQRKTVNIKTCQCMINRVFALRSSQDMAEFYSDGRARFILDRYLERDEFDEIIRKEFSRTDLFNYLYKLSDIYKKKNREIRSLRLLELASEIELTDTSIKKILRVYIKRHNKENELLTKKTQTLFE
ncbi:hypothetical protein P7E02_19015 [Enterococcus hulanensis]|uniref:hypothetical protein n=1 Tax=Enterococcus hulanensis TaxID=2559929 RepID=UPI00288C67FD|nr:hypothetical protein [Enterococcus hulanensis]MDT2661979.1 hypothetical protein [Enterococcus hulanensis]